MVEMLNLAGGSHILASKEMMGIDNLGLATKSEIDDETQKFMATCLILRSNEASYK